MMTLIPRQVAGQPAVVFHRVSAPSHQREEFIMPRIAPLPESDASDKAEQTYGRIKEALGVDNVPAPFLAMGRVPAFLQDCYMNYKKFVHSDGKLTQRQRCVIA